MVLKKIEELTKRQKNIMMKESCVDKMGWPITFTGPSTENQVGARSRQRHSTGRFGWLKPFVCCNLLGVMFNGIVKALGKTTAFWCRPAEGNELISCLIFVDHSLKKIKRQYLNFYFSLNHWSVIFNSVQGVGGSIFSGKTIQEQLMGGLIGLQIYNSFWPKKFAARRSYQYRNGEGS